MKKVGQNQSLVELVLNRLRDDIVFAFYQPGQKLNIESLKKRYEVGGTPVREALNRLVVLGLVEALPLKGFRVNSVTIEYAKDLLKNRTWVESLMIQQALECADDMWESLCVAALHRLKRCQQAIDFTVVEDLQKWVKLSQDFMQQLFRAQGSFWLSKIYTDLYLHVMRYEYRLLITCKQPEQLVLAQYFAYNNLLNHCLDRQTQVAQQELSDYVASLADLYVASFTVEEDGFD
jgi:GntR family transcriptional regulator, carbon starvation induced regulator